MILSAVKKVLRQPSYALLAIVVAVAVFSLAVWLPNLQLIAEIMAHPEISASQKLYIPLGLLGSIYSNFSVFSAIVTATIAVLFGVNVALTTYFLRRRVSQSRHAGAAPGVFGIVSGVIGIGCAACGSLLITSMLALLGAGWLLTYLPLAGGEFGILGVLLLIVALQATAKQILNPSVCAI